PWLPRPPPISTLFPYTTLFRSGPVHPAAAGVERDAVGEAGGLELQRFEFAAIKARALDAGATVREECAEVDLGVRRRGRERQGRSEEHTSELQSRGHLVCRLLL